MSSKMNNSRIMVILLFALTFTMIGWAAPVVYASYVPQDDVIEQHKFMAQDVSTGSNSHYMCFDRTVHQPSSGQTFTELYIVNENGKQIKISSDSERTYFQSGRRSVISKLNLPENLTAGEYKYILITEMRLADGRVSRTFAFESNTFEVSSDEPNVGQEEIIASCQ